ncbi:nucleolar pre-ribosomal-associated protein 1 [Maudiozyma exigua]|uniref:Nucleolar pre-ribosomal-associated protein 1 n=1 Tax=Maudiozyma exigua TaxID=34358 RepID=A0A9P7BDG1_MAUEX|nr:nucleolar pre-ribosomal-associated protein 1 [Kazachstania exigua]
MENRYNKYGGHNKTHGNNEKVVQSNDVDNGVLDTLETILNGMGPTSASSNYQPLIQFFRKGFANQVVQTWSYYAQTNNHPKTSHSTSLLVKLLPILAAHPDTVQQGSALIRLILTDYMKVLYRCLNNLRAQIANPILRLMKSIVLYNNSQHVEDFLAYFDLSLPSLIKLLTPVKTETDNKPQKKSKNAKFHKTTRETFLDFWIILISKTPSILRRDLLTDHSKIMGAWFKFIDKNDSDELVERAVTLFTESILEEKFFKRTTKCKVLNELTISKLHHFYYSNNKELLKKINHFFVVYGSSPEFSIAYPDNCVWFEESPITGANTGAEITVGQKVFKLHNKLLFNLLRVFKPWEDDLQSSTVIKVLAHTPELVAPYCTYIATLGAHDPKMTSYWFGMTLLLSRIIELDVPEFIANIETDSTPVTNLVLENIIPSSLTKLALTKALQHDKKIVQQLACQLIVFVFQKLHKILKMYNQKGWSSQRAVITTMVLKSIPDLQIFTSVLTQAYMNDKDNEILPLTIATILGCYGNIFPNFFAVSLPSPNIFTDILEKESFNGMDVAILDQFLQFQKFNGTQMKWWNPTANQSSLFCSLLKLASSKNTKNTVTLKITRLLIGLLHGTVIFDSKVLASPVIALINSLQIVALGAKSSDSMNKIWKLLDECIARCVKTIYKYVDMSKEYNYISPFIMAITEQWKYVDKNDNDDIISKWLCIFMRMLVLIGESESGVINVVKNAFADIPETLKDSYLDFSSDAVETLKAEEYLLSGAIDLSYAQFLYLSKWGTIEASQRVPVSDLDASSIIVKLCQMTDDKSIKYDGAFKNFVDELSSKLAGYCLSSKEFQILAESTYKSLFSKISSETTTQIQKEKTIFVINVLIQAALALDHNIVVNDDKFVDFVFKWLLGNTSLINTSEIDIFDDLSVGIVSIISDEQLTALLSENSIQSGKLVNAIVEKLYESSGYNVEYTLLVMLIAKYFDVASSEMQLFIKDGRIQNVDSKDMLSILISDVKYSGLLFTFIESRYFTPSDIESYIPKIEGQDIKMIVANNLFRANDIVSENNEDFVKQVVEESYSNYKEMTGSNFKLYLKLFTNFGKKYLSAEQNLEIINFATDQLEHKYSDVVIELVKAYNMFDEENILKWLGKMTLYITKIFTKREIFTEKYQSILSQFTELIQLVNLWDKVNTNIINSQLEAIVSKKWINNLKVVNYALLLVLSAKQKHVQSARLVQFILNNEYYSVNKTESDEKLRYQTIALLYSLFTIDAFGNSNITVQKKLLILYNGSISGADRLILQMLEIIESTSSLVWVNNVFTWDFLQDDDEQTLELIGNTKLFVEQKEGLILTLKKKDILFSTENYRIERPQLPELSINKSNSEIMTILESFYDDSEYLTPSNASNVIYDPLFLLLVSIQNKELVDEKSGTDENGSKKIVFQVKKYLTAGLLQYIIGTLGDSNKDIVRIARLIITQMMYSLEDNQQFKDGNIFKILLKKIIFSTEEKQIEENGSIVPIIWYSTGRICNLLLHPTTQLYEKAYRWVLNSPLIRSNDIPMMYEMISPSKPDINFEYFYAQLSWVLRTLEDGIRCKGDVDFLKRRSVMEWLSNVSNVPYLNANMNSTIAAIIYKIQRIEDGGSTLITRFGGLSDLELKHIGIEKDLKDVVSSSDKSLKRQLILKEQKLNTEQIMGSYVEIIRSKKRLVDWTMDDTENLIKRVCH